MKHDHDGRRALNVTGGLIAGGLVLILGFLTWALVYKQIPTGNENAMTVLLGILATQVTMIVGFYFGNNASSKRQSETIDTLAKTAQTAGAALAPNTAADVTLEPGQTATVAATPDPESRL